MSDLSEKYDKAQKAEEIIHEETGLSRLSLDYSVRYGNFKVMAGNASVGSVDDTTPEQMAEDTLEIVERRDDVEYWATPPQNKGSMGQPWSQEQG